jgi:hypothetical protein
MDCLKDEPDSNALEIQNPLNTQLILSPQPQEQGHPDIEFERIERARFPERDTGHGIIMFVLVLDQESRLDLEDAIEIETTPVQEAADRQGAALGAVNERGGIDDADTSLDDRVSSASCAGSAAISRKRSLGRGPLARTIAEYRMPRPR